MSTEYDNLLLSISDPVYLQAVRSFELRVGISLTLLYGIRKTPAEARVFDHSAFVIAVVVVRFGKNLPRVLATKGAYQGKNGKHKEQGFACHKAVSCFPISYGKTTNFKSVGTAFLYLILDNLAFL
jgi:hypothetical protein